MENDCQRLVAVIPALPIIKVYMSLEILVYLYLVPLLLTIFFYFLKALIIRQSALQTIHIIQVIFNGSIIKHLHMISDRIFLLIFFMLNMFYSIENYLNFLSLQLDNDYTSFGTFKSLDEFASKAYIFKDYSQIAFWKDDPHVQNIKPKIRKVDDTIECIENLSVKDIFVWILRISLLFS